MKTLTQPLHDEHQELFPYVDRIRATADLIGDAGMDEIRVDVEDVYDFLAHHLTPHAQAEDAALYPVVQKAIGGPDATRTMSRDHVEIGRYIEELATLKKALAGPALTQAQAMAFRRVLYGLYAMIKLHFAKEEEVYLPILDKYLSPQAASEMFEAMEAAAARAKQVLSVA